MDQINSSLPAGQREAQLQQVINRLGRAVAFEGIIILVLLLFVVISQANPPEENSGPLLHATKNPDQNKPAYLPAPGQPNGETIFDAKCNSCHVKSDQVTVGPGLKDVSSRIPKGDWKYKWLNNPSALAASGDEYAQQLFAKFAPVKMPAQNLSKEEIDAVFAFLDY